MLSVAIAVSFYVTLVIAFGLVVLLVFKGGGSGDKKAGLGCGTIIIIGLLAVIAFLLFMIVGGACLTGVTASVME